MKSLPNEIRYRDRAEWLGLRRGNVGASEVAALFGLERPYQMSLWTLWQVKAGRLAEEDAGMQVGERARWGLLLEDAIMMANSEEAGWRQWRRAGYVKHPTIKGMGCSPDFFVMDDENNPVGQAETKNIDYLIFRDEWTDKEPPEHMLLQTQSQMACTLFGEVDLTGLVGGNRAVRRTIEARPKIISAIEERVQEFWHSIEIGKEPPIDGKDGTLRAVKNLHQSYPDRTLDIGDNIDFLKTIGTLDAMRKSKNDLDKEIRQLEAEIYAFVKDAEIIKSNGQIVLTAKTSERKGYEVKPTKTRQLRIPKIT